MADARHFTEYGENTKLNGSLQQEFQADNSYEYRMNLIQNAEKVMDVNNKKAFLLNGVTECKEPYAQGTMLPEAQMQVCNTRTCKVVTNDANGVGLGRQYSETPNALLDAFTSAPMTLDPNNCASAADLGNYYPVMAVENDLRLSTPGAGRMPGTPHNE